MLNLWMHGEGIRKLMIIHLGSSPGANKTPLCSWICSHVMDDPIIVLSPAPIPPSHSRNGVVDDGTKGLLEEMRII